MSKTKPPVTPPLPADVRTRLAELGGTIASNPRQPKDPVDVVELLRLVTEHDIDTTAAMALTGLSRKTLLYYGQGRTSSGRQWDALRKAMDREGIELEHVDHSLYHGGGRKPGKPVPEATKSESRSTRSAAAQEVVSLPVEGATSRTPAPQPVPAPQPGIGRSPMRLPRPTVESDGTLSWKIRPGDPGYAETLRALLGD